MFLLADPSTLLMLCVALCSIHYGSSRSLDLNFNFAEQESNPMTMKVAILMPIIGSAMLVVLFYFLNLMYYFLIAIITITALVSVDWVINPTIERIVSCFSSNPKLRLFKHDFSASAIISVFLSIAITVSWIVTLSWPISNLLAICIVSSSIAAVRVPSFKIATAMMGLFFIYDIFWVFLSGKIFGKSVMINVASGLLSPGKAIPMVFILPRLFSDGFSILGLGDMVLPGLMLCFLFRHNETFNSYKKSLISYLLALILTILVLSITGSGQPALLYIAPAVVATPLVVAWRNKQHIALWNAKDIENQRQFGGQEGSAIVSSDIA